MNLIQKFIYYKNIDKYRRLHNRVCLQYFKKLKISLNTYAICNLVFIYIYYVYLHVFCDIICKYCVL